MFINLFLVRFNDSESRFNPKLELDSFGSFVLPAGIRSWEDAQVAMKLDRKVFEELDRVLVGMDLRSRFDGATDGVFMVESSIGMNWEGMQSILDSWVSSKVIEEKLEAARLRPMGRGN